MAPEAPGVHLALEVLGGAREQGLERDAELDVADQLLLITHHEHAPGEGQAVQRVRVVRSGKTSQPEVSP